MIKFHGNPGTILLHRIEKESGKVLSHVSYTFDTWGRLEVTPFGPELEGVGYE